MSYQYTFDRRPQVKYVKVAQVISEKRTFKIYTILYMYITQGQGQTTPRGQNFD